MGILGSRIAKLSSRKRFLRGGLGHGRNANQGADGNNKTAYPHPYDQRADENFDGGLIALELAKTRQNQIKIFTQTAQMGCPADRRLLRRKKF
jgi:hypothetical protein